jgi:hypothetical protein
MCIFWKMDKEGRPGSLRLELIKELWKQLRKVAHDICLEGLKEKLTKMVP